MSHNFVDMRPIYDNMQHDYADLQHTLSLKLSCMLTYMPLFCLLIYIDLNWILYSYSLVCVE